MAIERIRTKEIIKRQLCPHCMLEVAPVGICARCGRKYTREAEKPYHLRPGTLLVGRYELGAVVAEDSESLLYAAFDLSAERRVKIRELFPSAIVQRASGASYLQPESGDDNPRWRAAVAEFTERNRQLAFLANEPDLLATHYVFSEHNTVYAVEEFAEGITLDEFLKQSGTVSPGVAFDIALALAGGLKAMHSRNLIHPGLDCADVLLCSDGRIKLLTARRGGYTQSFIPPERFADERLNVPASNVYSACAVVCSALTGADPASVGEGDRVRFSKAHPELAAFEAAILKGMEPVLDRRWQSAAELKDRLLRQDIAGVTVTEVSDSSEREDEVYPLFPFYGFEEKPVAPATAEISGRKRRRSKTVSFSRVNRRSSSTAFKIIIAAIVAVTALVVIFTLFNLRKKPASTSPTYTIETVYDGNTDLFEESTTEDLTEAAETTEEEITRTSVNNLNTPNTRGEPNTRSRIYQHPTTTAPEEIYTSEINSERDGSAIGGAADETGYTYVGEAEMYDPSNNEFGDQNRSLTGGGTGND